LFTLVKRRRGLPLPWNRLKVGSPVIITPRQPEGERPQAAVVSARSPRSLQVAVDHWLVGTLFDVDLAADEVTRNRERAALQALRAASGRARQLRTLVLGEWDPEPGALSKPRFDRVEPLETDYGLNDSQREAIEFALSARDYALIHGPPGTGKTTTLVALITEAVARGSKVLACAPSNTAVDNLLERLVQAGQRVVRLGHPARVKPIVQEHTLDAQADRHENARWIQQLEREAETLYAKAERQTRGRPDRGERQQQRREARECKQQARHLEWQAVQDVLHQADVVCSTTPIDDAVLGDRRFDWVVVDEACQSTEPGCWIPLLRGERFVLAGDYCQLAPTVISLEAAEQGYSRSLMERLARRDASHSLRQLVVQYRMHQQIMDFSSREFYAGTLVAESRVRDHRLGDLPGVVPSPLTDEPLRFIDTAGADYEEELEPEGSSRRNPGEARLVLRLLEQLHQAGVRPEDIGVIAPYAAQVRWLRQECPFPEVEIDTVDGFQGREKEAVIISLVRSNRSGEIGFLGETRRMNVALTRARRKLIVTGDSSTLGGHPFYRDLLEYFAALQAYGSVWEEIDP